MVDRPKKDPSMVWFLVPLLLLGAIAAALFFFGANGPFSNGGGYSVR